jgi:hypothetical protein
MAVSSSSSSLAPGLPVWLYNVAFVRVALVNVPTPLPPVVLYQGIYYAWSVIHWCYFQTTPPAVQQSTLPDIYVSHAAFPVF